MNLDSQMLFASAVCAGALAIGIMLRRRHNIWDYPFAAGMLVLAAEAVCNALGAQLPNTAVLWQQWRLVVTSFLPGFWLLFSLTYARGNALEFVRRWRFPLAVAFLLPVGIALVFRSQLVFVPEGAAAKIAWRTPIGGAGLALSAVLLIGSILVITNLERTFRATVGTMRWRIKFMFIGTALLFAVRIYATTQMLLFRGVDSRWSVLESGALIVASILMLRSFFRTSSIDLDVYPSPSVIRGSLTVLLAGIYLLIVGAAAKLVAHMGGGNVFALEALLILVAIVLLVLLVQSDRLRVRMGRFVSRHFQRPLYDYRTVWRRFTEGTASQVDQAGLCRSLVRMVADIFQCLSVAIWIVDEKNESMVLAASTFLSEAKGRDLALSATEAGEVIQRFLEHPEPVDIETSQENFAVLLRRTHPCEFPRKENRVCLPMIARGQVIALLMLGDRVGGASFSTQDFDMLKCVGDHATANLLNVQLAHRLLQAKEMEAFQTMAAFFVHDLKNAASTLSLMLKNMPVHFDDPAFREDALRGVSKSVAHINHVIGRLGLLRSELKIRPALADLNAVVAEAVTGLDSEPGFSVVKELAELPKVTFDREQIAKVVTNLVLNAKEAMSGAGEVRLSTGRENGWVVLKVQDRGSGMSQEFIERSLFRPFQTTKKNGLGIGMFQSKMIVEVHGGRIAVASQPGAGTTFQVFLPAKTKAE